MNIKVDISKNELQDHLKEQLEFLECSANSYDNGFEGEVKRIAVTVRVLVHDTNRSKSLLNLLNKKNIEFCDTSVPFDESNLASHSSLVQLRMGKDGSKPLPVLDDGPFLRNISFEEWWNGVIFVDRDRNEFSRRDIVLTLANKEGGAHVDEKLDQKYADLRKNNTLGWYDVSSTGKKTPSADQVPAAMRQIAHELLKTLKDGYTCHRQVKPDDDIFAMGASLVKGSVFPPIPNKNLVKSRKLVGKRKIGRNKPCPCGSGKKYKKCCISKT